MDSCYVLIWTHPHGIAPGERSHLRLSTPTRGRALLRVYVYASAEIVIQQSANTFFICTESFCNRPVGIQNGRIRNSAMSSSSRWDNYHAPWLARLHRARSGRLMGAWSSRPNNHYQFLQVDMGRSMKLSGINTQGRQDADQWVTAYFILYSSDGTHFSYVREWWDNVKVR